LHPPFNYEKERVPLQLIILQKNSATKYCSQGASERASLPGASRIKEQTGNPSG